MEKISNLQPVDEKMSAGLKGLRLIAFVMTAEVLVSYFSESEVALAAAVAFCLFISLALDFFDSSVRGESSVPRMGGGFVIWTLVFTGIYGALLGLGLHNNFFYLAADIYHWWVETILVAYLAYLGAMKMSLKDLIKFLSGIAVLLGILAAAVEFLGTFGVPLAGGYKIPSLGLWRIEAGMGFPILLTILLVSSLRSKVQLGSEWSLVRFIGISLMLLTLFFTFKRTTWLTFLGALYLMFAPRRLVKWSLILFPLSVAGVFIIYKLFPQAFIWVLKALSDLLTYNPNYTVEETLAERVEQIAFLIPYLKSNSILKGYGFGAEFNTYWPAKNTFGSVHYIHNLYVYNVLQLGVFGFAAFLMSYLVLGFKLFRRLGTDSEYEWLARGAFAAVAEMLVAGLTLNSTHTVFNGLVVGLGFMVINSSPKYRRNKPNLRSASPGDDY